MIDIEDINTGSTYIGSVCNKNAPTCIKGTFVRGVCIGISYVDGETLIFWDSYIYKSANSSCKFVVLGLKFGISWNCYLYLQVLLDKILYFTFT